MSAPCPGASPSFQRALIHNTERAILDGTEAIPFVKIRALARLYPAAEDILIAAAMTRLLDEIEVTLRCIVAGQEALEE